MLEKEITDYKKNGFCVVHKFVPIKTVNKLNSKINKFFKEKSKNIKGKNINFSKNKINSLHDIDKFDPFFKKFAKQKLVINMIEKFLKSKADFRKSEVFNKPAKIGLPSPMHQDNFYWCVKNNNALTVWISLDYSNKRNGGVSYFKGSHKLGVVKHIDSFAPGSSQKIDFTVLKRFKNLKKITPKLKPGDALIHHCLTFHGSGPNNSSKNRRGFTMQFKDKFSPYDNKKLSHYNKRLNYQVNLRKKN